MSTRKLHIAKGLNLPPEAATKTFAILAQRRKGKTYTASVMAEEMCAARQPWVALDPTGAAERPTESVEIEVEKEIEVPVLANGTLDSLHRALGAAREVTDAIATAIDPVINGLRRIEMAQTRAPQRRAVKTSPPPSPRPVRARARAGAAKAVSGGEGSHSNDRADVGDDVAKPKGVQLDMLKALGSFEGQALTATQLALLVGKRPSGGYFRNMLSALRTAGYVEGGNEALAITAAGLQVLDEPPAPLTQDEVLGLWRHSLKGLQLDLFDLLVEAYPDPLTPEQLGEATGKAPEGGYFRNMLSSLRTAKLVVNAGGGVRASDDLFIGVVA